MKPMVWIAMVGALSLSGCAAFESACESALPVVSEAQSLSVDAQVALDSAEQAIAQLPPAARVEAARYLESARAALRASAATLALASTACSKPDLREVFEGFVDAWAMVRAFVGTLGGAGTPAVPDPIVFSRYASR